MPNKFMNFFYNADDDVLYFIKRYEQNEFDIMFNLLNMPFSSDDVKKAIQQLQYNKSCGPDLYINEIFIHGKDVLIPYVLSHFNKSFDIGYFPESWSEGYVIPLNKKGNINDVNNYRGSNGLVVLVNYLQQFSTTDYVNGPNCLTYM